MLSYADNFPLAFRSGGCFLDAETPKVLGDSGSLDAAQGCYASPRTIASCSSFPPVFSPSKSYSDAISATETFSQYSLRNFFAVDKPQQLNMGDRTDENHDHANALAPSMQRPQFLAHARASRPTHRLKQMYGEGAGPCAHPLIKLGTLPPIRTMKASASAALLQQVSDDPAADASPFSSLLPAHEATMKLPLRGSLPNPIDEDPLELRHSYWTIPLQQWGETEEAEEGGDSERAASYALDVAGAAAPPTPVFFSHHVAGAGASYALASYPPTSYAHDVAGADASVAGAHACTSHAAAAASATVHQALSGESGSVAHGGGATKRQVTHKGHEAETSTGFESMWKDEEETEEEEEDDDDDDDDDDFEAQDNSMGSHKKKRKISIGHKGSAGPAAVKGQTACRNCFSTQTPQWREGPEGPRTLCNACGLRYRKGLPLPVNK